MSDEIPSEIPSTMPGKNGGKLKRGGTNAGAGRPPQWFKDLNAKMICDPKVRKAVATILANPDHPHFAAMWKAVAERGYGKPESKVDVVVKHYREAIDEVRTGLRLVA